jgi:predicted ATPase
MDNFEHLLASSHSADAEKEAVGEKLIAEILQSAPQVKVLVTTRERLNLTGETVLPLGGLPVDSSEMAKTSSAAQLFWQHVQLVRPNLVLQPGDEKHINHICRLVAGMPLALILAASWAEMLSLAEIAAEIERDLDFLETDMADLPERQRSVRAVFDASWRRLSAEEQAVFAQLSVFRGGFTRQAAQAVTGASLRTLRGLVHKLLTTLEANGRYQIHELLRQYGAEQLTAVHRHQTAKEAHAAYYLDLLEQREVDLRGRNQLAALNEIDADLENIRLAWDYALAQGDEAAIMQALEGLHLFIDAKGRYIEGIPLLEQAKQQLVPNGDQTLNPTWGRLTARARFMRWTSAGYYEGLEAIIEKCLEIAQKANDRFEIAFCLYFQTVHLFAVKHEPENSLEQLHQALTIFRNIDDHIFTARSLAVLGVIHLHLGEPSQSRARLEEALALARTNGAVIDTSYTLSNLCEIVLSLGDYGAGEEYIREALTLTRQLKQRVGNSYANVLLGLWLLLKGEVDRAEEHIQEGWREAELLNFAVTLTYAPALLALCQALPGDYQRAQQLAEKSLVNPMNDRLGHILAHWALAVVHTGLGDVTLAWDYVRQTVEHIKHYPSVAMLTWILPVVAVLHAQNEQWETAVHHLALAYTHPLSPTGYLDKWSLLKQTQTRLQAKLGEAAYQSAWAQGQKLDLEALFGDE